MKPKKRIDRAPQSDIQKTAEKACNLTNSSYATTNLQKFTNVGTTATPTPTHEPAMPAEVYYNHMENSIRTEKGVNN